MSYVINKTSGEPLLTLDDGVLDTSTSLGLVGRNYVGYGETQNENFLHLMENFANNNPPSRPIQGQNWFDTSSNQLKIYNGTSWAVVGSADVSENQPETPSLGSLWLRLPETVLYVFDGSVWQIIGPETAEGFKVTRFRSTVLLDAENNLNPVILLTIDGNVLAIVAQREFVISNQNSIDGFSRIFSGINLNSSSKVHGDLQGVAQSANRLSSSRTINGVPFNGESNITIKSQTEQQLRRGLYLTGQNFNGDQETIWAVDASSENIIGKVVARDSSGGFSAGTITANLIGNVQGNVSVSSGTSSFDIVTANQFIGANLSGNARTASRLQVDRKINNVIFNGTQDITISSSAQTLTGNSINPTVTLSNLTQVGTLVSLSVLDTGVSVGSGSQLRLSVDNQRPTLSTSGSNIPLRIRISDTQFSGSAGIDLIPSSISLAEGGDNTTSVIPSSLLNLGHPSYIINKIYANSFIGNLNGQADTSITSNLSNNLLGGSPGAIPYQSATGQTSFLPAGIPGQVLKSTGTSEPIWGSASFAALESENYLIGPAYDGSNSVKWSVDATPSNVSGKIVARDENGDFSARFINASLIGTPTAPTPPIGDNSNRVATTAFIQNSILPSLYPIGSIYINATNPANPTTYFGFGTWVSFGAGQVPVGFNASDPLFDASEKTGGSKNSVVVSHTHTATVTDPGHTHNIANALFQSGAGAIAAYTYSSDNPRPIFSSTTGITVSNSTTGSSGINANLQPYITVYMWKRTA